VVEEDVRTVTEVFSALVGIVVGGMSGYVFGVLRTLNESRNERRDAALAEIFKEMALFYRYLVSWTDNYDPDPNNPTGESSGIPAKDHVGEQYRKFILAFYGNAIWLGKDTYDLIQEFSTVSRDLLNELNHMRADRRLPDGTDPKDRRKDQITPKYNKVQNKLRDEVESSRYVIPFRRFWR
jgi:hypothetical protein